MCAACACVMFTGASDGGCSPLTTVARGLLLAHTNALTAPTAWEAAQVESLQVRMIIFTRCNCVHSRALTRQL